MALKRTLLLVSFLASSALTYVAPQWCIHQSFLATFLSLLSFAYTILFIYGVILYPNYYSSLRNLPQPTGNAFLMGQAAAIRAEATGAPHQRWINSIPNDGMIRYLNYFNEERIFITKPRTLAEVLTTKNYDFVKPSLILTGLGRLLGVGVLLAEGDEHKVQRKNLMPAFAYRHIKNLYPIFWVKSSEIVKALKAESDQEPDKAWVAEIGGFASRATLDIIGVAGMGKDFGAIQDPTTELNATYRRVFQPSRQAQILALLSLFVPMWLVQALPVKRNREIPEAAATIRRICRELIEEKKLKNQAKGQANDVDIINVALASGGFTESNLVDNMMTMLLAGHETTSTATIWACLCLSQHPHYQTRLREEIHAKLPSIDDAAAPITAEMFDQLPFLNAFCNEVLRLYPPVSLTLRQAAKDTSICGQYIPKGTRIILCPSAVNRSKELWGEDAMEFKPERWLGPGNTVNNSGGANSNYSFLTFLHGPRSCIGQAFARAEFAVLVAGLVGRFEMELEDKEAEIKIQSGVTARPKGGLRITLKVVEGW
ncbi:MAG: hypothetical protein Q9174_003739 [Haloplaca sp. 1 TL-2023]